MKKLLLPAFAAVSLLALPARAALPRPTAANFAYGAKLTVAGYPAGKPALTGFPVLVRIANDSPSGFAYSQLQSPSDGADLCFIDMFGNGLPFEIDTWDTTGESLVWVRLPTMQNDTEFVMCWGSTASGKTVCGTNPWPDYVGVWHLNETNNASAYGTYPNSTATAGIDGQKAMRSLADEPGIIGKSVRIAKKEANWMNSAKNQILYGGVFVSDSGDNGPLDLGSSFTISGWFKYDGTKMYRYDKLFFKRTRTQNDTGETGAFAIQMNSKDATSGKVSIRGSGNNGNGDTDLQPIMFNNWAYLSFSYNGDNNTCTAYTNGSECVTVSVNAIVNNNQPLCFGNNVAGFGDGIGENAWNGWIDEVRLSAGPANPDRVSADWATQANPAFLTVGTAEEYVATDAPLASLSISPIHYTNATARVAVSALGTDASSAALHVEFAEDNAFASIVKSENVPVSGSGYYNIPATGLNFGTPYYVRASITNNLDRWADLESISFATATPGSPAGTGLFVSPGFSSLTAQGTVSDFGTDAESATMWLEASTAADFATVVTSPVVDATVGSAKGLTVSGLSPNTVYHLRIRIRNNWGQRLDTFVPIPSASTRAEPFAATGIGSAVGANGTIDITFPVTAVYDGARLSAVLTYDGVEVGTKTCTAAETLSWTGVAAASGTATATVVVTAMLDGETFTKTWTASVVPGVTATAIANVSTYASAVGALWMRPGDVAELPELTGNASYQVLNPRFASIDGTTLTALEPGIVGVRYIDPTNAATVMGVVILPDAIGDGSIYVFKESERKNVSDWSLPVCWDKVENGARAASNDSFPQNANDIAILPFYTSTGDFNVRHLDDITIGGLYVGQIRPDVSVGVHLERKQNIKTKTLTFQRTDGKPVEVKICPNSEGSDVNRYSRVGLGNSFNINVIWASDAIIDGCSSETGIAGPHGRFYVKTAGSTNTLQDVTLTFRGLPGYNIKDSACTDTLKGVWTGTGTIVKEGMGGIAFDGDFSQFSGTVRELSGPNLGDMGAPAAGVLMRAVGASNVTAHVYGYAAYNHSNGSMTPTSYNGLSRGTLGTGGAAVTPDKGAQGPAKGLYMHGGTYRANIIGSTAWGIGVKDEKVFDVLSVGAGLNLISEDNGANKDKKPINAVRAKNLVQTDRGTLVIYDQTCNAVPVQTYTNNITVVEDWENHVVGAEGDNQTSDVYPIIPWILVNRDSSFYTANFASFDATGRIVQPKWTNTEIDTVASEDSNAYVSKKSINRNAASKPNIVVQSLFLENTGNKYLGTGRTLTITSGGLVLYASGSAIGQSGRNDNGSLVLGDAMHPAYVWTKDNGASPNEIWAETTAAGGFVKSWPGNLVLGGTQTGIAQEIAVNAGTLQLGNETKDCVLAEGIPIRVCAGATLKLPRANTIATSSLKIDGSGGAFGKVELPLDQKCASLAIRDVFESEDWTTLPAGTYGSSGSGAEFVRDDLFAGTGVLTVGNPPTGGSMIITIW